MYTAGHQWLIPIIPATQEAEIRRNSSKPAWSNNSKTLSQKKKTFTKKGLVEWLKV
jgi:hypothetical protein